jgi:hypothetical protein
MQARVAGGFEMKEQWYADKRDLVKWATLIHVARKQELQRILQIAFLRPSDKPIVLQTTDGDVPFPPEVWDHFRNLRDIEALGKQAGVAIEVFGEPFQPKADSSQGKQEFRIQYFKKIEEKLNSLQSTKLLVFLDPDTGLEPKRCGPKHVKREEVAQVFRWMKREDTLVFYQHRPLRYKQQWIETARDRLAASVGMAVKAVRTFSSRVAADVVFLEISKDS